MIRIIILLIFTSLSCGAQDTIVVFRIIDSSTSGNFIVFDQRYKNLNDVHGHPFVKETYKSILLVKRELYNRFGHADSHLYSPSVVEYDYDSLMRVEQVLFRDKRYNKINVDPGGYNSARYEYDSKGRISKVSYFDKNGDRMNWGK